MLHYLELSEAKSFDDGGRFDGFDGIARDMTAQRFVQEELRQAKEQAETAQPRQEPVPREHEPRDPDSAQRDRWHDRAGDEARAVDESRRVPREDPRLRAAARAIIEDILDLSRIEAGRLEIERVDFDLDELLADISDVVGMRAGQKNVEIIFSTDCRSAAPPARRSGAPQAGAAESRSTTR